MFGSSPTLFWPIMINETIMQQNRIETLHHNGNPLKQNEDARTSPVASYPIRTRTEEHSCWLGHGTPPQMEQIHSVMIDESPAYLTTLLDAATC